MIFDAIVIVPLVGILGWTWTCAALLRFIGGQLNTLIHEVQQLASPHDASTPL
jgi:hypothetical protein